MNKIPKNRTYISHSINTNDYILQEISRYLIDVDHMNFCIAMNVHFTKTYISTMSFMKNLDLIIRSEYTINSIVDHVKWFAENNKENVLSFKCQLTFALEQLFRRNTNVMTVEDFLKFKEFIYWRTFDYNILPESFYDNILPYVYKPMFYSKCNKMDWLENNINNVEPKYIKYFIMNQNISNSISMMTRLQDKIDWKTIDYNHLSLEVLKEFRSLIDSHQFNMTIKDYEKIQEFLDIIDWELIPKSSCSDEDEYYEPNFDKTVDSVMMNCNETSLYSIIEELWDNMTTSLQIFYTRFPHVLSNYLMIKKVQNDGFGHNSDFRQ